MPGNYRCISKPFKRYLFKYADNISNEWVNIVNTKYKQKYINKLKKLGKEDTDGLQIFLDKLIKSLEKEKGIAHCKAREYWLRRGPRLVIILILAIGITIGLAELLIDRSLNEHKFFILVGLSLFIFNIYMLYQRLPDSIAAAMSRIGHDHYKAWKETIGQGEPINVTMP